MGFESQYDNPLSANSSVILDAFQSRGTVGSSVDFYDAYLNGSWNIDFPDWTGCTHAPTELLSKGLLIVTGNDGVVQLDYTDQNGFRAFARGTDDGEFSDWVYYRQGDSDTSGGKVEVPVGFDKGRAKTETVEVYTADKVDTLLEEFEQNDAYTDKKTIVAPFNVHNLPIGSYKFASSNWTGVTNAPALPSHGHFLVHVADNCKVIRYVAKVADAVKVNCVLTRCGELVINEGSAESWNYFVQGSAEDYGEIKVPSAYDKGQALDLKLRVLSADYIREVTAMNRGKRIGAIAFNDTVAPGNYYIDNTGGFSSNGSTNPPPTSISKGRLEVKTAACVVTQHFYPENGTALLFRERSQNKVWSPWYTATEGNVKNGDKVQVPVFYRQGIGMGYEYVEVYHSGYVDSLTTTDVPEGTNLYWTVSRGRAAFSAGTGISIVDGVVSYTGSTTPIVAGAGISYNSSTGVIASLITQYTDAMARAAFSAGTGISIVSGVISYTGSTTPLSAAAPIAYNSGSGVISWTGTTSDVPEGSRLYYTDARARAAHSAGTGISYNATTGVIASTITQYTDAMARAAISASGLLSYNSTTGVMSLSSVPWANISGAPDFSGTYVPITRSLTVSGTTNNIVVTGGAQTLGADRSWAVNLAALHVSPLSGGSATQVPYFTTDIYGRVTGITNINITYPVTSVNGQTGAVSLSTDNVAEGTTNKYFSTTLARAAFSAGTGISIAAGVISSTITQYTNANAQAAISATAPITYASGVIGWSGTTTNVAEGTNLYYTDARARAAHSAGTGISYNSTTGVISLGAIHAGLSGGSVITTPAIIVNSYGQVTSLIYSTILFPVTSVNGQTGGVVLTTTNIAEGTNLYWTNARGDARYSALGHTHAWSEITSKPTTISGYGITDAYTKTEDDARFVALAGSYANPTWIASLAYSKITGVPDFAGTYAPLARNLAVFGTTNNIVVTGGIQTLGADRSWTVNLAALHLSPLSGGSATQVPQVTTDIYGRVTGITNTNITYPVTSVNGQTGAVSLSTDNVAEGTTNKYYTDSRVLTFGDGRYSLLGHTHTFASLTSKPTTLSGYGITDAIGGSGTANYVTKFTAAGTVGISQMTDDGTFMKVGTVSSIGRFGVQGAIWASADTNAVSYYVAGGGAIRAFGTMYLDSYDGEMNFRTGVSFTYTLNLKSTGQVRFPTYTSSSSWGGTKAGLLGFDSSGNVITVATTDFAAGVHNHDSSYYTKTQLNTSGGGGIVHWNNLSGKPGTFPPEYHTHSISEVIDLWTVLGGKSDVGHTHSIANITGLQSALDSKTPYGHSHSIGDIASLQSTLDSKTPYGHGHSISDVSGLSGALAGKSDSGHNHDGRYLQYESDPTEVTGLSASVGSNYMQLYIGKKNGGSVGSGVIDLSNIRDADPYGVSGVGLSMDSATVLRVTVYLRNGGNYQATCSIFTVG